MSTPLTCCNPCQTLEVVDVPGTEGAAGAAGAAGTNGVNAFTALAADVTIPAVGANVSATMGNNSWMSVGQTVFLSDGTDWGTFVVASKTGTTVASLTFQGAPGDGSPGAIIGTGGLVSPGGRPQSTPLTVASGGTGVASITDRSIPIGRGTAAINFAVPGAATQPLLSTGAATNPAFGALNLAGASVVTGSLPVANGGTAGTTKATAQTNLGLGQATVSEFSAGTAYTLTNSTAVVVFGTSGNMEVVLNAAGNWHLYFFARTDYVAATFAAEQTVQFKLRRSNNTPADITNSTHEWKTQIITTLSHTAMLLTAGPIPYTTALTTDNIQMLAFVGVLPGAGSINVVEGYIVAVPASLT